MWYKLFIKLLFLVVLGASSAVAQLTVPEDEVGTVNYVRPGTRVKDLIDRAEAINPDYDSLPGEFTYDLPIVDNIEDFHELVDQTVYSLDNLEAVVRDIGYWQEIAGGAITELVVDEIFKRVRVGFALLGSIAADDNIPSDRQLEAFRELTVSLDQLLKEVLNEPGQDIPDITYEPTFSDRYFGWVKELRDSAFNRFKKTPVRMDERVDNELDPYTQRYIDGDMSDEEYKAKKYEITAKYFPKFVEEMKKLDRKFIEGRLLTPEERRAYQGDPKGLEKAREAKYRIEEDRLVRLHYGTGVRTSRERKNRRILGDRLLKDVVYEYAKYSINEFDAEDPEDRRGVTFWKNRFIPKVRWLKERRLWNQRVAVAVPFVAAIAGLTGTFFTGIGWDWYAAVSHLPYWLKLTDIPGGYTAYSSAISQLGYFALWMSVTIYQRSTISRDIVRSLRKIKYLFEKPHEVLKKQQQNGGIDPPSLRERFTPNWLRGRGADDTPQSRAESLPMTCEGSFVL